MNFLNYLEVIEKAEIKNKIIYLDIFRKGVKIKKEFNGNNSFFRSAWDKTYCEMQKVWAKIEKLKAQKNLLTVETENQFLALKLKLSKLTALANKEYKKGKPYLINTDYIVGETENSWLIENLSDKNQTALFLSKKWAPDLKSRGIFNYEQIEKMKSKNKKQEFIIFLHPEKSVAIYQNGSYIGNAFLSKMIWFFEAISGLLHKFKSYWSKAAIHKRRLEKERIFAAKKRLQNAILANKITLENSRKENIKKVTTYQPQLNQTGYLKIPKSVYAKKITAECSIVHNNMYEENDCEKIHIFK